MCILTSIQRSKRYLKLFFRYPEWKVIKVGGTISYCVSYLRNVPLSTRPPPDYNYNSTLLSSVLLNCTFILFLVLSNVWDSAGGRNTKSYFSACSKKNIYFAAQCKCATCLRSVPECNIYLQRVEQCISTMASTGGSCPGPSAAPGSGSAPWRCSRTWSPRGSRAPEQHDEHYLIWRIELST